MEKLTKLYGARILLVEDNVINQQLVEALMDLNGINVEVASNGKEALLRLEQEPFDGVLMDCQMPVMDGYETTRQLRKIEAFKDLPIIAITANAMPGDRQKVLDAGMNDYLTKPIDFDQVLSVMEQWIITKEIQPGSENVQTVVSTAVSEKPQKIKTVDINQRQLNLCLQRLEQFLLNFDTEALDAAVELADLLDSNEQIEILDRLIQAVNDYNYEKASDSLDLLKGSLS